MADRQDFAPHSDDGRERDVGDDAQPTGVDRLQVLFPCGIGHRIDLAKGRVGW